jgi:hypothetical protein
VEIARHTMETIYHMSAQEISAKLAEWKFAAKYL